MKKRIFGIPMLLVLIILGFVFRKHIPGLIDKIKGMFGGSTSSTTPTGNQAVKDKLDQMTGQ